VKPLIAWLAAAGVAYGTLMNVCALLFQCGCRSWWTGAATHCNIHQAGAKHCPWCTLDPNIFWGLFAGFVVCELAAVLFTRHRPWWQQFAAGVAAYLVAATLSAGVLGVFQHYWN
jgi:hypothetical protein